MRRIYHIVPRSAWQAAGNDAYQADSLAAEGFIHCSNADQVARVANAFFKDQTDLVLLCIDPARLTSPLRDEDPGVGERFPHVHGPIDLAAIVEVRPMTRDSEGRWLGP